MPQGNIKGYGVKKSKAPKAKKSKKRMSTKKRGY